MLAKMLFTVDIRLKIDTLRFGRAAQQPIPVQNLLRQGSNAGLFVLATPVSNLWVVVSQMPMERTEAAGSA